jgi:hypothetical protein
MFASPEISFEYFKRLGMITHTWALIETSLDHIAMVAFGPLGGSKIHKRMPKPLDLKLQYLRDWHEQLPDLRPYSKHILDLLGRVDEFSEERHHFIHGYAIGDMQNEFGFIITKMVVSPKNLSAVTKTTDLDDMLELIHKANDLCAEIHPYVAYLNRSFVIANHPQKPTGEFILTLAAAGPVPDRTDH